MAAPQGSTRSLTRSFFDLSATINHGSMDFTRETYMSSKAENSEALDPGAEAQEQDRLRDSTHEEEIRRRAYEIYLERGEEPGHDLEHWLQAERELTAE